MKQKMFFEANDGTLFRSEEQCRLYDIVQSAELRKIALEKAEKNIKALQYKIDLLKGRQQYRGPMTWAGRFDFTRGIDKNSKQAILEKGDIEASWRTVSNFAFQHGYIDPQESASFNEIYKCLAEKFKNIKAVYFIYRYAKKCLAEVDRSNLLAVAYYAAYTAAANSLMVKMREELAEARKKLRAERKNLAALSATDPEALKATSVKAAVR